MTRPDPFSLFIICASAGGRGVPDISLQALEFLFVFNKRTKSVNGTSFSAPVRHSVEVFSSLHPSLLITLLTANAQAAASIISLLNDHLLSTGRPSLGFLNPWLYGRGFAGLNDVTSGSNPGCNTLGFSAIPGWDPVRATEVVFLRC